MHRILRLAAAAAAVIACSTTHAQAVLGGGKGGTTFPIVISQPGSYKLAGNLIVPAGVNGIEVATSHVTIDLNGFTISGPVVCTGGYAAMTCTAGGNGIIRADANVSHLTLRNGSVKGFHNAVEAGARALIEDVSVTSNGGYGIVAFDGSIVRNVRAVYNKTAGVLVHGGVISNSTSTLSPVGFTGSNGLLTGSMAHDVAVGVSGSYAGPNSGFALRESVLRAGTPLQGTTTSLGNNLCNGAIC